MQGLFGDVSPLESLNLTVNYVSHWTYLQGLRELFQNFMDAAIENHPDHKIMRRTNSPNKVQFTQSRLVGNIYEDVSANFISYDFMSQQLVFENDKSFPVKCMLMGCSEKGPEALGQFGQGMKVTMIVLRKAGMDLTFASGDKIYFPTLKKWDHSQQFINAYEKQVLYIKILNREFLEKTVVTIDNISKEKFEDFLYISLALLKEEIYQTITVGNSTLIFTDDPKLKGKIYKKGVRLELREPKDRQQFPDFSYNFEEIEVGRDRDCVNNAWDLYRLQSILHCEVLKKSLDNDFLNDHPELRPRLRSYQRTIFNYLTSNDLQTHYLHQYTVLPPNRIVQDCFYRIYLELNNTQELYPAHNHIHANIVTQLNKYGLHSDFYPHSAVSWQIYHNLTSSSHYTSIEKKIQREILDKDIREVSGEESEKVQQIVQKIKVPLPEVLDYSFKVKGIVGIACCLGTGASSKVIYLNPVEINNHDRLLREVMKLILK